MPSKTPGVFPGKMYNQLIKLGFSNQRIRSMTFPGRNENSFNLYSIGKHSSRPGAKEWRLRNNKKVLFNLPSKIKINWRTAENMKKFKSLYGTRQRGLVAKLVQLFIWFVFALGASMAHIQHTNYTESHNGKELREMWNKSSMRKMSQLQLLVPENTRIKVLSALSAVPEMTKALQLNVKSITKLGKQLYDNVKWTSMTSKPMDLAKALLGFKQTGNGSGKTAMNAGKIVLDLMATQLPVSIDEAMTLQTNLYHLIGAVAYVGWFSGINLVVTIGNEQTQFSFLKHLSSPKVQSLLTIALYEGARRTGQYVPFMQNVAKMNVLPEMFESELSKIAKSVKLRLKNGCKVNRSGISADMRNLQRRKGEAAKILQMMNRDGYTSTMNHPKTKAFMQNEKFMRNNEIPTTEPAVRSMLTTVSSRTQENLRSAARNRARERANPNCVKQAQY